MVDSRPAGAWHAFRRRPEGRQTDERSLYPSAARCFVERPNGLPRERDLANAEERRTGKQHVSFPYCGC